MLENERITYEPQFPNFGNTDMVRPFLRGPAVACYPDGAISLGKGIVIEELGIDEMRVGLFKAPLMGDAFGGKRVLDSNGQLISWSLNLMPTIEDNSRVTLVNILSGVSDIRMRRRIQSEISNSLPHLVVDPEEGIYLRLKNGNRIELTSEGIVVHEKDDQDERSVEEGNFICMPASELFFPESVPMLSEGEIEVQLDYSDTPEAIFKQIEELLQETDFSSEEERLYLELEIREIINPVVRIFTE